MTSKTIEIAYSPDTDDAFMMWALREEKIPWGDYQLRFYTDDIQVLNVAAQQGTYDVTAISVATYPLISDQYIMTSIGGSVARSKGPALIVKRDSLLQKTSDLLQRRIAVPGLGTSAALAARVLLPKFQPVAVPFDKISHAVSSGDVDAGILIHELQLDPAVEGFRVLGHLGDLWQDKYGLPLPLGTNAIKRSLGEKVIQDITTMLRLSVEYGLAHRDEAIEFSRHKALTRTTAAEADRYIRQFVNQDSLTISRDLKTAVEQMFSDGGKLGLWEKTPNEPLFFDAEGQLAPSELKG